MSLPQVSGREWLLVEDGFTPKHLPHYESIFALANGYGGVRASLETNPTLADPGMYLAGVFDRIQGFDYEIVNLPCWLGLKLNVNGFDFDLRKGELLDYRRALDMRQGILFTRIVWRDAGRQTTRFESARLMHRAEPHLALLWGTITPLDYSANLRLTSSLDAWAVKYGSPTGSPRLHQTRVSDLGEPGIEMQVVTRQTEITVAMASRCTVSGATARSVRADDDRIAEIISVRAERRQPVRFEKRTVFFTSRDGAHPASAARSELARFSRRPVSALARSHTLAWKRIWDDADIRIEGDARAQKALRYSLFHLASLANRHDDRASIGAKGLHGNGYRGLYFWDTEIYLLPFYVHTDPAVARTLLLHRYHTLDDARANARALGRLGAFYPWHGSISGRGEHWKGWQEHVGSAIAYGVDWYVRATGDRDFLLRFGAEMIIETARYWQSRVGFDPQKGRYVLRGLMGPDEIHGGIDNNAYTNQVAKWHLRRAAEAVRDLEQAGLWDPLRRRLGIEEADVAKWRDISEKMYLSFNPALGLHEQFDGYLLLKERAIDRRLSRMQYTGPVQHSFKPTKVAQQADTVLMYLMFAEEFPEDVRRAGYRYYEPRCSHTSSLSRCIYAAEAAQAGLTEEAYRLFRISIETDLAKGKEIESETGIHAACMGGNWLAAVVGFGGVWFRGGTLIFRPRLPRPWRKLSFALRWQGRTILAECAKNRLRLRTRGGRVTVRVADREERIGPQTREFHIPRR
jgi:kojibiose phosphorylase